MFRALPNLSMWVALWAATLWSPAQAAESTAAQPAASSPEAPAFTVAPARSSLKYYPCSRCHEHMEVDPTVRPLKAPHPKLHHGQARMWCYNCHNPQDQNTLRTLLDEPVAFSDSHLICAQCHATQARDWRFGAHGKRVANWQGQRELYSCSACHEPHNPALKPRPAEPPPAVRAGLERPDSPPPPAEPSWRQAIEHVLENFNAQK